jgi:hypothetical protein
MPAKSPFSWKSLWAAIGLVIGYGKTILDWIGRALDWIGRALDGKAAYEMYDRTAAMK